MKIALAVLSVLLLPHLSTALPRTSSEKDAVITNAKLPDYKAYLIKAFDIYSSSIIKQSSIHGSESEMSVEFADEALRLWALTGDEKYYKAGRPVYDNFVAQPELQKQFDVFKSYPLAHATLLLQGANRLPDAQLNVVRSAFLDQQQKGYEFRFGNRELGVMAGASYAAFQLFPHDPKFQLTREKFKVWWPKENAIGDLNENSGNYSTLGLSELIKIVRAMDREGDLRDSDRWRNTFSRYRAMVSPSGHLPEFGDDYFEEGGKTPLLYLMEYAAVLYDDPTFAYTARKLFARKLNDPLVARGAHNDIHVLGAIFMANDLLDLQLTKRVPVVSPLVTGITQRYDEFGLKKDDKLFLRPSLEPGSPSMMMELYPWGDHSHQENRGSITYYEVDNVPLFRGGYGRYWGRQTGDGGNAFYLQPDGDSFPIDSWKSGVWKSVRMEAARLPVAGDPPDQDLRTYTGLTYVGACNLGIPGANACNSTRLAASSTMIDNIRLEGPAGVKELEDFEGAVPPLGAAFTKDASHGAQALLIEPSNKKVALQPAAGGIDFSLKDYKILSYDIKQTGDLETVDFRIPKAPNDSHTYDAWHTVSPGPFYATLTGARTETKSKDSYAEVRYDGYGTWDSMLVRHIVFTREGVIVIRDVFKAGATATGWTSGEVWQLPNLADHGDNWFASKVASDISVIPGDEKVYRHGTLVYFAAGTPLTCGTTNKTYAAKLTRTIAWGKTAPIKAGDTITMVTIVLPTDENTDLKTLAAGIVARQDKNASHVRFRLAGMMDVDVSDGSWSVHRSSH